jgi:predicted ATP-grasp superfamily ATP-dependent carboligase
MAVAARMKLPTAIVLGVDTPIGLTVIRELGRRGVPVHGIGRNSDALGRTSRYLSGFSLRPEGPTLAQWLPERIFHTGARALFAIAEDDLVALAALPEEIEGCRILTPRKPQLDLVLDKSRTLALAAGLGIDVPESWQPLAGEDFAQYAETLTYPVVAKWADPPAMARILADHGLPLIKAEHAASPHALLALLDRYAALREWPIVQPFCSGFGFAQMLHMAGGKPSLMFQHKRIHEWPAEGGFSTLCESVPLRRHTHQMEHSAALLAAIGWEGPAMVEYRHDPKTGKYWLMEVNGRFWGSLPLALHCGAEFAWEQYRHRILGESGPARPRLTDRRARFLVPETRRLFTVLFKAQSIPNFKPSRLAELTSYLSGYFDPRLRHFIYTADDPRPFFQDLGGIIHRTLRREKRPEDL